MNKTELIVQVYAKNWIDLKDAEKVVKAAFDTVAQELAAGGKVLSASVLKFVNAQLREGRNPQTVNYHNCSFQILHSKLEGFEKNKLTPKLENAIHWCERPLRGPFLSISRYNDRGAGALWITNIKEGSHRNASICTDDMLQES